MPVEQSQQDAGAAPAISKEAAKAVIAARLRALCHPPDLLDQQAVAALIEHAGGSGVRLRAALASALFLASTEDAPRIGRALVNRALQESGDIPPALVPAPRPSARWRVAGGTAIAGLVVVFALLTYRPWSVRTASLPSKADRTALAQANTAVPARAAPAPVRTIASPAPPRPDVVKPVPNPPSLAPTATPPGATMPPPVSTSSPDSAAQAAAAPAPAPPDLPAAPPARVMLLVSNQDPAAAQRLGVFTQHLHDAGVDQVVTKPSLPARARRAVSYFFADDLPLAQRITHILASEGWPRLASNSLTPRLVIPPPGMPQRQPGLIEIQLP